MDWYGLNFANPHIEDWRILYRNPLSVLLTDLRVRFQSREKGRSWGRRLVTRFVNSCIQLISTDRLTHCGAHTPRLSRSGLLRRLELVLRHGFLLDRLPAVIRSKRSYPAMPLAGQLADQRFTIPGPLVQRNDSLNSYSYFLFHQRFNNQFVSQNAIVDF